MEKSKIAKSTWIGLLLSFLSPFFLGLMACCHVIVGGSAIIGKGVTVYAGLRGNVLNYLNMWNYSKFPSIVGVLGVLILIFALLLLLLEIVIICLRKKGKHLLNAIGRFLDLAFLPYLLLLLYTQHLAGRLNEGSMLSILAGFFLTITGHILLTIPYGGLFVLASKEEKKEEPKKAAPFLTEEDVKSIVNSCLAELDLVDEAKSKAIADKEIGIHVQSLHPEKKEEEEEPADEPADEGETEEAPASDDDRFALLAKRRRAKFETRLKAADQDLRSKYYELRDYIRSYGLKDRMSIPGITFSLHRDRYVFITISGKKLKVYYALNPDDYAESTIPVIANSAKKYEDLPAEFKVRSDLSVKRAKILVDDVMKAKGVSKPEEKR